MSDNREFTDREWAWLNAWCGAAAKQHTSKENAVQWADACLVEFDKRFPEVKPGPIVAARIPPQAPITCY